MKRLIVCCDGTWDTLRDVYPTNIVKLARAIKTQDGQDILQLVYYDEGLGSNSVLDRLPGGALGIGLERDISDAYAFICCNYESGDEIYLFGFSRGAYTVRCLAQIIGDYGVLNRSAIKLIPKIYWHYRLPKKNNGQIPRPIEEIPLSEKALKIVKKRKYRKRINPFYENYPENWVNKRMSPSEKCKKVQNFFKTWFETELVPVSQRNTKIKILGCFDTVIQVGIPDVTGLIPLEKLHCNLDFHNNVVNSQVELALHALGIDEQRRFLRHTPMEVKDGSQTTLKQVWFVGNHGCIGSGTNEKNIYQMANITLDWMIKEISFQFPNSLSIALDKLHAPHQFDGDDQQNPLGSFKPLGEFEPIRPIMRWFKFDFIRPIPVNAEIHRTVCERQASHTSNYFPTNLPE
ncbi:MAG: DUF2235 domain-containing protein [Cyanobacteria bacterium P01_G01_bin.49]